MRIVVDFDSDSQDEREYEQEAGRIAEVIWNHLDGRVLVVDISSTFSVDWEQEGLPPTVSFTAVQLRAEFGPRPSELDVADVETVEDFQSTGSLFAAGVAGVWLLAGSVGAASAVAAAGSCRSAGRIVAFRSACLRRAAAGPLERSAELSLRRRVSPQHCPRRSSSRPC